MLNGALSSRVSRHCGDRADRASNARNTRKRAARYCPQFYHAAPPLPHRLHAPSRITTSKYVPACRPSRASRRCCSCTAATATLVLGALLPAVVRRPGLSGARAEPARPRRERGTESLFVAGLDDYAADVEHVASRFAVAARPHRTLDGRRDHRAHDVDATAARGCAAGADAPRRPRPDGAAPARPAARVPDAHAIVRRAA